MTSDGELTFGSDALSQAIADQLINVVGPLAGQVATTRDGLQDHIASGEAGSEEVGQLDQTLSDIQQSVQQALDAAKAAQGSRAAGS